MLFAILQATTVFLVVLALTPALAHALELPGKLRLAREDYLKVQRVYYPGFTWAGFAEPAALLALILLTVLTPAGTPDFWLRLAALTAFAAMHAVYWLVTHPVNAVWLGEEHLSGAAARFFATGAGDADGAADWRGLRDRWEYSHVARAACALLSLGLALATIVDPGVDPGAGPGGA